MTTRKRVGGGFKIVHLKDLSPRAKLISPDVENLKEHHSNSEKETRKDDIVTFEQIDLDINSYRDDSSGHGSMELPSINEQTKKRIEKSKKIEKHEAEKLELPVISPDKISPQVTRSDKFSSLVTSDDKFSSLVTISGKISSLVPSREDTEKTDSSTEKLKVDIDYQDHPILHHIQDSVIGHNLVINTPFGETPVTYCDYVASGRSLSFIEDFIRSQVYPSYANTHSTTGFNARQTTKYREDARNIIRQCVNANKDDVVIFTGSGATAAVHKLLWGLKINQQRIAEETVVFIGPYEHHSNILPWREFGTQVVRIRDDENGLVDLGHLKTELKFWKDKRRHMLVCMSACSNVTGIITDVDAVSQIAHKYGAMVVFDYAAGAPYLNIDMNPEAKNSYKDAIFLSPHKFVGGPGTPGLLIAKRWMFKNSVPDRVGGGTVRFVTREAHAYVGHIEEKEEGGTPAIIESIRAGMVFELKREIGHDVIYAREEELCQRAFVKLEQNPCIFILGSHTAPRVPIFSFLTMHPLTGRLVHHNFISTLLSDLYGIQARGGCACAGPYAEDLMGISEPTARRYMWFLSEKAGGQDLSRPKISLEVMKPGFTRINLAYFYEDSIIDFVLEAVDMVTKHGWKLLPQYTFDCRTGSWWHKSFANVPESELKGLINLDLNSTAPEMNKTAKVDAPSLKKILKRAESILTEADDTPQPRASSASRALQEYLPRDKRALRWFLSPQDAINILKDEERYLTAKKKYRLPFKLVPPKARYHSADETSSMSESARSDIPNGKRQGNPYLRKSERNIHVGAHK